jgi:hypothetical protein
MADGIIDRTGKRSAQGAQADYQTAVRNHAAFAELEAFGRRLRASPLDAHGLRVFLASSAEFFREVPGGILGLALRITDEQIERNRFGAVRAGASVLTAAVDEYGLGHDDTAGRTHHELFEAMVIDLGVALTELDDAAHIVPAARELAAVTAEYYRRKPVPVAAGFHFASEITSDHEFKLCFDGLAAHAGAYGMAEQPRDQAFGFYFVHTVVEPEHGASSARALGYYDQNAAGQAAILAGINAFMDAYGAFWYELNLAVTR